MLRLKTRRSTVFLSHAWCGVNDPHRRVVRVASVLREMGWRVWIDDTDLVGNVDGCIARGIQRSSVVIVFLTREYCRKINRAANGASRNDNCYNEFNYAIWARKPLVPVIMDPTMRNPEQWSPGVIPMRLSCELYVDGCCNAPEIARRIDERLKRMGFSPRRTLRRSRLLGRSLSTTVWL